MSGTWGAGPSANAALRVGHVSGHPLKYNARLAPPSESVPEVPGEAELAASVAVVLGSQLAKLRRHNVSISTGLTADRPMGV
jgi:hypothetical protein